MRPPCRGDRVHRPGSGTVPSSPRPAEGSLATVRALTPDDLFAIGEAELGPDVEVDQDLLKRVAHEPLRTEDERDAYPGIHLKAAALLLSMLRERPFGEGNGRIALLATTVFLNLNGQDVEASDADLVALVAVTHDGDLTLLQVAAALERLCVRLKLPEA